VAGHDRNASVRVLVPETFDLFERAVKIAAAMNNEKQRRLQLELDRKQVIGARYRGQDTKICSAQGSGESFPEYDILPNNYGRKTFLPAHGDLLACTHANATGAIELPAAIAW
jgi:hypothetical protein